MQPDKLIKLSPQEQQTLAQLHTWLYSAGASYSSLQVQYFGPGYRGVASNEPIKKNSPIVFIPKSRLITLQMAMDDPISKQLISKNVQLMSPKHTYLSIFLLQELLKGEKSEWKLYLRLLPKDHSNFPINYTNHELSQLIGSPFLIQIHEKVYDLKRDYDRVFAANYEFRKYKFRDFCWARTIIGSRIFGVHIEDTKTDILAPFADMLNHRLPKQTTWNYLDDKEGFLIETLEDIPQGVEVFDSYGKKCNSRYLLNYGFVVENNTQNLVCLRVEIDGPLKQRKLKMLQTDGVKILKVSANMNSSSFYETMGFLRFKQVSDPNHLGVLEKISGVNVTGIAYVPTKTPPITTEVQSQTWETLQLLCENSLKEYPTTKEQDEAMLLQPNLTENIRNILILRLGEKTALCKLIEYAKELVPVLRLGLAKSCDHYLGNQQKDWSKYLGKVLKIMPGSKLKKNGESTEPETWFDQNEEGEEELQNY